MNQEEFIVELLDKVKFMKSCITEFTSIEDIEKEVIESMKDIKKVNDI